MKLPIVLPIACMPVGLMLLGLGGGVGRLEPGFSEGNNRAY